jgi:hypothetical protein
LTVQAYGGVGQSVVVHGDDGNDTFSLISGGIVFGDAGSDIFSSSFVGILTGATVTPIVADFSSQDRFDLGPYLKNSANWNGISDPFATGIARLVQVNSDVWVQGKPTSGAFQTLAILQGVSGTSLLSSQFGGFTPIFGTTTFVSLSSPNTPTREGSTLTLTVSLNAASGTATIVNLGGTIIGPGSSSTFQSSVTIAAGATSATFKTLAYDDPNTGGGLFFCNHIRIGRRYRFHTLAHHWNHFGQRH